MDNVPLPPAEVATLAAPALPAELASGTPVWRRSSLKVRLVAVCFKDGAAPVGWNQIPPPPGASDPCFRPDLRTREGQEWQKRLNSVVLAMNPIARAR